MFLLAKPDIKMLLLSFLMLELSHKKTGKKSLMLSKGSSTNILPNLLSFLYRSLVRFSVTFHYVQDVGEI